MKETLLVRGFIIGLLTMLVLLSFSTQAVANPFCERAEFSAEESSSVSSTLNYEIAVPEYENENTPSPNNSVGTEAGYLTFESIETMSVGDIQNLNVQLFFSEADISKLTFSSSNSEVVTVDAQGNVIAISEGVAEVYITYDGKTWSDTINVVNYIPEMIDIDPGDYTSQMMVGETQLLHPSPIPADVPNVVFSYESSNYDVLTVNANGRIETLSAGTAIIKISACGIEKQIEIHVKDVGAQGYIDLGSIQTHMQVGDVFQLNPTLIDENGQIPEFKFFSSNQSVATVSSTGLVTCVSKGQTIIRIESGQLYKEIELFVDEKEVSPEPSNSYYIALGDYSSKMKVGEKQKIYPKLIPYTEEKVSFVFESSDPNIATVNDSGEIFAVSSGVALLSIEAQNSKRSFEIQVVEDNGETENVPEEGQADKNINYPTDYSGSSNGADYSKSTYSTSTKPGETTVLVNKYSYKDNIFAGEKFDLDLQLVNYSQSKANNIVVKIVSKSSSVDLPFFTVGTSNAFYVSNLGKGDATELTVPLSSQKTLDSGIYEIGVDIKYYDTNGTAYESESIISIALQQENSFDFFSISGPEDCYYGEETYAEITFGNTGKSKIYNVKAIVETEECDVDLKMNYFGNLDSGGKGTQGFSFKPKIKEKKTIDVNIKYIYEDSLGINHEEETKLSFKSLGDREKAEMEIEENINEGYNTPQKNGEVYKNGFIVLLLIIICFAGYSLYKKEKEYKDIEDRSMYDDDNDDNDDEEDDDDKDE